MSASAAFAAAFCSSSLRQPAAELQQMQQQCSFESDWQVFAAGPLVVEYSWGEPAEQLQQRVAAAAAARLNAAAHHAEVQQPQQEQDDQQQQQQHDDNCQRSSVAQAAYHSRAYDYVVGADLLYDTTYHQSLLTSLQQLCAPHTQVC
jgi:hypothetical protein